MSIPTYKIKRWDGVLFGNSVNVTPIIYVKPDDNLLQFAKENNDTLLIKIKRTSSIYDNKFVSAILRKSVDVPNCLPNFFKKTGYYVLILKAEWHGYPDYLGEFEPFGFKGGEPVEVDNKGNASLVKQKDLKNVKAKCVTCGMNTVSLLAVFGGIFVILLGIIIINKK